MLGQRQLLVKAWMAQAWSAVVVTLAVVAVSSAA